MCLTGDLGGVRAVGGWQRATRRDYGCTQMRFGSKDEIEVALENGWNEDDRAREEYFARHA